MTTTATALTVTTTTTTINDVSQPPASGPRQSWGCSKCGLSFDSGEMQRVHMKSRWHIYNLKRHIASLPPVTLEIFESKIQAPVEQPQAASEHHVGEAIDEESSSRNQCLFCRLTFDEDADQMDDVIEHMFSVHGLFIPDQDHLLGSASFIGYLATQIRVWHECLYCGTTRTSTSAIQSHMRDSGHCMLNFEKEPELCEFWKRRSDGGADSTAPSIQPMNKVGQGLQLLSGKMLGSKSSRRPRTSGTQTATVRLALPQASEQHEPPRPHSCRQLSRRDEMGVLNIGSQQRHALVVAVKRGQKEEAMARRANEWTYGRKANDQKHDQNYGALSWAKGGMHNLLPR